MAVYDVTAYGAVGDGVTDDTAAIQAAVSAATAAGAECTFPAPPGKNYKISAPIVVSYKQSGPHGWSLRGLGGQVGILQTADNTPCFQILGTEYAATTTLWRIENFVFSWANQQVFPANANSAGIQFAANSNTAYALGPYLYTIREITNVNGCRAIAWQQVHPLAGYSGPYIGGGSSQGGSGAAWAAVYERITNEYSTTGAVIWHDGGDGGQPNVMMSHIYINQGNQQECGINLEGVDCVCIDNYELNFTNGYMVDAENSAHIYGRNWRIEGATFVDGVNTHTGVPDFVTLNNASLNLDGLQVTNCTLNFTNPRNVFNAQYASAVVVDGISFGYNTTTSGVLSMYSDINSSYPPGNGNSILFKTAADFNGAPAGFFSGLNNNPNPQNLHLLSQAPGLGATCAYQRVLSFYRNNLTATGSVKNQSSSNIITEIVEQTCWIFGLEVFTDHPVTAGSLKVSIYKNGAPLDNGNLNVTLTSGSFGKVLAASQCNNSAVASGGYKLQAGDTISLLFTSAAMVGPTNARANVTLANLGGSYNA